jgi:hypothetical protein
LARAREIALLASVAFCSACDIVQGFDNAGDALFPPVETYLDVPGYQMTTGHYRYLDMVTTSEPYILARSTTTNDNALYIMRFNAPKPCAIPNVARYWTDGSATTSPGYVAYFDTTNSGILNFADLNCKLYELPLRNANLPVSYAPKGLVLQVGSQLGSEPGSELVIAEPATRSLYTLAGSVQAVDVAHRLVLTPPPFGLIGVYDYDWTLVNFVGNNVAAWASAFDATFFQDDDGIHRMTITDTTTSRVIGTSLIASDACDLTILPTTPHVNLVAFHEPCGSKNIVVWDAQTRQMTPLNLDVDIQHLKIAGQSPNAHPNLATDPFFALYLTDVIAASNTGNLHLRSPDGTDQVLGSGAALERADFASDTASGNYTGGFALLDVDGETGRFVHFALDGSVNDVVTNVIRSPAESAWTRLVVAVDDQLGNLVEVVGGQPVTVAENVPRSRYAYLNHFDGNPLQNSLAWFHDLTGETGTLSLAAPDPSSDVLDDQGHEPLYRGTAVAHDVFAAGHGFMANLPGFVYFSNWDDNRGTGSLEYTNVELEFSATVSDGVSDYLQPGSGLLYTVPYGSAAGVWLARGK